jgi:hypothetical protein
LPEEAESLEPKTNAVPAGTSVPEQASDLEPDSAGSNQPPEHVDVAAPRVPWWQPCGEALAHCGGWLRGRFRVGLCASRFTLDKDTQGTHHENGFFGTIYRLEEEQAGTPHVYMEFDLHRYVGFGAGFDDVRAGTWDDGGTDGTFEIAGWQYYAYLRYPNDSAFTPYLELGQTDYDSTFHHNPEWFEGGRRYIETEDTIGSMLGIGCDVKIADDWNGRVYYQQTRVDLDFTCVTHGKEILHEPLPLDHRTVGIGISCRL